MQELSNAVDEAIINDNDYYVNHNFQKEVSELGSIFLDKDCSIEKTK